MKRVNKGKKAQKKRQVNVSREKMQFFRKAIKVLDYVTLPVVKILPKCSKGDE